MQTNNASQSSFFNPRVLIAFVLCFAGALLAMFSFAATPLSKSNGANANSSRGSVAGRPNMMAADAACPVNGCFTLAAPGDAVFWDGPHIPSAQVNDPEECEAEDSPCFEYQLTVPAGGERLRVAIDVVLHGFNSDRDPRFAPPPGVRFRIQVKDPAGMLAEEDCLYQADCPGGTPLFSNYSTEVFVPTPAAGDWTVLVIPTDVTDLAFRMRAKLEPRPADEAVHIQKPNLRLIPPHEPTFIAPAYPFGPAGPPGVSCMPEEIAPPPEGEGATHCLRFSAGVQSDGDGPLGIEFYYYPEPPQLCDDPSSFGPSFGVFQRLRYSDHIPPDAVEDVLNCNGDTSQPNYEECEGRQSAGCAVLHPFHGHFHYEGIYRYTLLKVTDLSTGALEPATCGGQPCGGHKRGFDPGDEALADWSRFYQDPRNSAADWAGFFAMSAGWGDIYEWNRSGQYVDFPDTTDADGFYVIQGVADVDDNLLESDETDNKGYALVVVQGETVGVCERGYGESPWDPNKEVLSPSSAISSDALSTQVSPACTLAIRPSAVSRKTHGSPGTNFNIKLPLTGNPGIECRTGGVNGNHQIVITFAKAVTVNEGQNPQATLAAPNGGSVDTVAVNNSVVTVNLKDVGNEQTLTLTLHNVDDGTNTADVAIPIGVLLGDTTANGAVNSSDIAQTKSKSGQIVSASNFRTDVTVNGTINSSDISTVKSKSGTALP